MSIEVIIMLLSLFSLTIMYVTNEYYKRKEENSIPKPIDNNRYRVVESTISDGKKFYVVEQYYFCNFSKKSFWNHVTHTEDYDLAVEYCNSLNDKRKKELEDERVLHELENTKNKKVLT